MKRTSSKKNANNFWVIAHDIEVEIPAIVPSVRSEDLPPQCREQLQNLVSEVKSCIQPFLRIYSISRPDLKRGAQIGNTCASRFPMNSGTQTLTSAGVIHLRSWAESFFI